MGPHLEYLAVSVILATVPTFCFVYNTWVPFTKDLNVIASIIPILFWLVVMGSLTAAAVTDPGIIPKKQDTTGLCTAQVYRCQRWC